MISSFFKKDKRWSESDKIEKLLFILDDNGIKPSQIDIFTKENPGYNENGIRVRRNITTFSTIVNNNSLKEIINLTWKYKNEEN